MNSPEQPGIEDLHTALKALSGAFSVLPMPAAIIGGVAIGLTSFVRATRDIDAMLSDERGQFELVLEHLSQFGFELELPQGLEVARKTRLLKVRHLPTRVSVDLFFGVFPHETQAVARSVVLDLGDFSIPVARAEDLVVLKALAGRPVDMGDIDRVIQSVPELDRAYIENHVRALAEQLEQPEIWTRIEPLFGEPMPPS